MVNIKKRNLFPVWYIEKNTCIPKIFCNVVVFQIHSNVHLVLCMNIHPFQNTLRITRVSENMTMNIQHKYVCIFVYE